MTHSTGFRHVYILDVTTCCFLYTELDQINNKVTVLSQPIYT